MTQRKTATIGELAEVKGGKRLPKGEPYASEPTKHPYLRVCDFKNNTIDESDLRYVTPEIQARISRYTISHEDVYISIAGTIGVVGTVPKHLSGANLTENAAKIVINDPRKLDKEYLVRYLATDGQAQIARKKMATSQPKLALFRIEEIKIPLPPLSEQKRIAEILDRAEALRAKRRAALALLDELTQSIFLDMFGVYDAPSVLGTNRIVTNPHGWKYSLLTDVAELATGHTPDRKKEAYWNGDIPWISLTDIRELDGKVAQSTGQCVTELGIQKSSSVKLPPGTVCFSRTASVGFVTTMGREMSTSQDFVNWIPSHDSLNSVYLMHALIQSRAHLKGISSGSTHKTIYVRVVEKFRVLVPPLTLQNRFAELVQLIDQQKMVMRLSLAELDQLFASLQHRAFRGEL